MTEDDFVKPDPAWWLVDPQAEQLAVQRAALGESFGMGYDWYTNEHELRAVYTELVNHHQDLFNQLDYIATPGDQERWLESFTAARSHPKEEPAEAEAAGIWNEEYGMLYRYVNDSYQYAYSEDQRTVWPESHWMTLRELDEWKGPGRLKTIASASRRTS